MIGVEATPQASSLKTSERFVVLLHALLFVLGFSVVFVIGWGGAVTALGQLFGTYKYILGRVGGVIVILFGLATLGVIRIQQMDMRIRRRPDGSFNMDNLTNPLPIVDD